jgi:hypothetical protein
VSTSTYNCCICGYEEAETLITRPRWTSVDAGGDRRDICRQCRETEPDWRRRIHEDAAQESGGRTGLLGALTRG